jgi:hypothetical protein
MPWFELVHQSGHLFSPASSAGEMGALLAGRSCAEALVAA